MIKTFIFLLMVLFINLSYGGELKPFTSDGCSAFPDGTVAQNTLWSQCCLAHDKTYWQGGSYSEREKADFELQSCVAEVGEPAVAILMLAGVRVGGTPLFPTQFRWRYGWPYFRWYQTLTTSELEEVRVRLEEYKLKTVSNYGQRVFLNK